MALTARKDEGDAADTATGGYRGPNHCADQIPIDRFLFLIEILVVLVVVGLAASLRYSQWGSSQQRELENEVRELYLLMQASLRAGGPQ